MSIIGMAVFAQPKVEITEDTMKMSLGDKNGYVFMIDEVAPEFVEGILKKDFKQYKGKYKGKHDIEIFIDDMEVKDWSTNTVDFYARLTETQKGTETQVWIDLGGIFLNSRSHEKESKRVMERLQYFSWRVTKTAIAEELEVADKVLEDKEKDLEKLQKEKEKMQDQIAKNEKGIQSNQMDIANNQSAQTTKASEIEAQREIVSELTGDLQKEGEKLLKSLQKEEDKLRKEEEKLYDGIKDMESEIEKLQREIERNDNEQEKAQEAIEEQQKVVADINSHLSIYAGVDD